MKFLGDPKLFPLAELKPHPAFQMLAAYSKKRETGITEVMRKIGFDPSEPLIVGIFGEERYVVGGYQRWGAAKASGREEIWIQEIEFESFDEAIAYEKTRYHLRRKGEDGDILFALCVRHESLQQHGGKRRGDEADKIKLENPNLISGVTQAMYHSHKRLRHKDIAIQLGVPKHRVDHVRSKFFRHLSPEEIAGIRQNKTDAYELVDHWGPKRSGTPKKKNQAKSSETSENLDNHTVSMVLVDCIREARKNRQVFIVTHNPNLAVVCDADQVVHASRDVEHGNAITYTTGSLENPAMSKHVTDVLEGTRKAFSIRGDKYVVGD